MKHVAVQRSTTSHLFHAPHCNFKHASFCLLVMRDTPLEPIVTKSPEVLCSRFCSVSAIARCLHANSENG